MTEDGYDEAEEAAERIGDLKRDMAADLNRIGVAAFPFMLESDVFVEGPLSKIVEWAHAWRSEIEELA